MRILIYGAGVIGSIIAGKMVQSGYNVTILARGNRHNEILEKGIILSNSINDKKEIMNYLAACCGEVH